MSTHTRRTEPMIATTVRLPESLWNRLRVLTLDPETGEPPHGAWGRLFEEMAQQWLERQQHNG